MRKLTGYIGALIIVFALMGSILAGYALNINGSSSVINEYERVTDVSGLYSHTQEPNYINYNPASNYIGYALGAETNISFVNSNDYHTPYKRYSGSFDDITTSTYNGNVYNNNIIVANTAPGNYDGLGAYYVWVGENFTGWIYQPTAAAITMAYEITTWNGSTPTTETRYSNDITISYANNTVTVQADGNTYNVFCRELYIPHSNGNMSVIYSHDAYIIDNTGIWAPSPATITRINEYNGQVILGDLYQVTKPNASPWNIFIVPKNVNYTYDPELGINYTESNRVNNYPVPGNNETPTTTQNQTINISNLNGITNYYPVNQYDYHVIMYKNNNVGMSSVGAKYSNIGLEMPYKPVAGDQYEMVNYKLSDILTNGATIPANTKSIKIELNSNNQVAYNRNLNQTNVISYCDLNIPCLNNGTFENTTVPVPHFRNYTMETNNGFGTKDYAIYNIQDNTVTVYSYDGVKKSVLAPENCYIVSPKLSGFDPSNQWLMVYSYEYREPSSGNAYWELAEYTQDSNRPGYEYSDSSNYTTNINLTYYIQENPDNKYFDITKGYSIKNDNVTNVIWDNEYNNGNIQLLFRAENASTTYHNDIIVGDNTISIDYNDGFSVTINGADPVAVGKWRNIVLNMDLRTGELSAIPVRTFNSYTNVVLDTASIFIGDMINPTPTNKIEWAPTSNSLMFNVYSTSVFMNTYGVVMVNPQLDITEYFTDLNGFYRMRLYNFSVLGSSITVNGVTANVNNNSITIDEQTVQIKDMAITYADGHAYISDSNVNIDLGEIVNNNISMAGAWYFETELLKGYTSQKMVYTWDWGDFILNNTQFCIMYIGIALIGLIVARRYCSLSITDYIVLIVSFAIALTVQVVA